MPSRRALLAALLSAVALAGCTDARSGGSEGSPAATATDGDGGTTGDDATTGSDDTTTATPTPTSDAATTPDPTPTESGASTPGLDLREANVTDVSVSPAGDGYRFAVTLYHDDDGESGYANWWQVESLDGDRLGRRELLHPHGTREFTRSETVAVPDGTACVVVRGHDETHGYGGQAALVVPESGAVRLVDRGPEPSTFAAADCP